MTIRPLGELRRDQAPEFGGKAANLGELTACGLDVSPGFAVGISPFLEHVHRCGLSAALTPLLAQGRWTEVEAVARERIESVPLDPALASKVVEAFEALGSPTVAVRSSATGEDASEASFAGQYSTHLGVSTEEDLLAGIRSCWASFWGARAAQYRHRRSLNHFGQGMGVVVQAMVPAEVSGVLFTVDPVAQRSDRMLVEVVEGLGESLVSGMAGGVVYRLHRDEFRVLDVDGDGPGIDRNGLELLWRTSLEVENHFGGPQDVEFGFLADRLFLFQSRPITTLAPELVEPLEPLRKPTWPERAVLPLATEHYTTAPKPLDNLVFTRLVGGAAEVLRRSGGQVREEDEEAFRKEIWRQAYRLPRHSLTWRAFWAGWNQLRMLEEDHLSWWMAGPEPTLREISAPAELEAMDDEALFFRADGILNAWEELLGDRMTVAGALWVEGVLKAVVTLVVSRRDRGQVLADLLRGLDSPVTESNRALWRLSRQAREDSRVLSVVRAGIPGELSEFAEGRAFLEAVDGFLDTYGHREGESWYLSTPTWSRDPAPVWRMLASLVEQEEPTTPRDRAPVSFHAARDLMEQRLRPVPRLRRRFLALLDQFRALRAFREQSHFDLTRPLSALQAIAEEWGRRLVDRGLLAREDQVFFLTPEEVREWLLGDPPDRDVVDQILARRRATYLVVNTTWQAERLPRRRVRGGLKGIPTSPGVARGTVRVIRGETQFDRFAPGEILVCPHTNPSWTPLFSLAAAVVTEVGGPASHAAIVAREYGIPCVMGVPGAMDVLRDGDEVVVDGGRGLVQLVRRDSRH